MTSRAERRGAIANDEVARLERMIEIRAFEEQTNAQFQKGIVHGTTHLAVGQEAVSVGIAAGLRFDDVVTCTYRGHGVALALGMTPREVLAEIMGRAEGCTDGVGGSMHLAARDVGLLPTFAIVGAGIPVAAGAAMTAQVLGTNGVGLAVFGDGASNIGAFHEGLNLAAIWQLPAIFVCENNHFGEYSRINLTTPFEDIARRADAYDMPATTVDGQDVEAVREAVQAAADTARTGGGPQFIEAKTYRFSGHSRADTAPYRDPEEFARWQQRDPITVAAQRLVESGRITDEQVEQMHKEQATLLADLAAELEDAPFPDIAEMFRHVWAEKGRR